MKYSFLFVFCLIALFANSQTIKKIERSQINENFNCPNGQMKKAWYVKSFADTILPYKNLSNKFIIWVDTNSKATNFISDYEYYLRKQSIKLDTYAFRIVYLDKWNKLTINEKQEFITQQKARSKYMADSMHSKNNQRQNQIWVINNTDENVSAQMQDWSYICILQALSKDGQWLPIQYWEFSGCGNSYHNKQFRPKTANSFITTLPNQGDYETLLRFKLLGTDKFYYSNEFKGKINFCDFAEGVNYNECINPIFEYKLDTLIQLASY